MTEKVKSELELKINLTVGQLVIDDDQGKKMRISNLFALMESVMEEEGVGSESWDTQGLTADEANVLMKQIGRGIETAIVLMIKSDFLN